MPHVYAPAQMRLPVLRLRVSSTATVIGVFGDERQHQREHNPAECVHSPTGLAKLATVTTEGLDLQALAGEEKVGDGPSTPPQEPSGHDHARRLEGRFGKTRSELLDRRVHGRCKSHHRPPAYAFWKSVSNIPEHRQVAFFDDRKSRSEAPQKYKI